MNSSLIENINKTVGPEDELYILGDFVFGTVKATEDFLDRIVCKNIHLVLGNHDREAIEHRPRLLKKIKSIENYLELSVKDGDNYQSIICFHFPILEWNRGHKGSWHLHGHTHGNVNYPESLKNKRILDVGVDVHNYKPISFNEIKKMFLGRDNISHHE